MGIDLKASAKLSTIGLSRHHYIPTMGVGGELFTCPYRLKVLACPPWDQDRLSSIGYQREREMFYLTMHSTHFIYGYMASDIWLRTILIVRKETRCRHIGYSYRLTARVLLYAPSYRQDNTYHSLCYTSRGALSFRVSGQDTYYKYIYTKPSNQWTVAGVAD